MQCPIRLAALGAVCFAAVIITLYAVLSEEDRINPLDPAMVEQCRSLARQSMDLAVDAARSDLDPDNLAHADIISRFQHDADELQYRLDELGCSENADRWAYGSFRQEMIELDRYIADLQRDKSHN